MCINFAFRKQLYLRSGLSLVWQCPEEELLPAPPLPAPAPAPGQWWGSPACTCSAHGPHPRRHRGAQPACPPWALEEACGCWQWTWDVRPGTQARCQHGGGCYRVSSPAGWPVSFSEPCVAGCSLQQAREGVGGAPVTGYSWRNQRDCRRTPREGRARGRGARQTWVAFWLCEGQLPSPSKGPITTLAHRPGKREAQRILNAVIVTLVKC